MDNYYDKYMKYKKKYLNLKQIHDNENLPCDRYIIFSGAHYYANGGWNDFFDTTNTLEKAKKIYKNALQLNDWAHIVDTTNKKIIYGSHSSVGGI